MKSVKETVGITHSRLNFTELVLRLDSLESLACC